MNRTPPLVDAVVTAFDPDSGFSSRVEQLVGQVRQVWVVDDGSSAPWPSALPASVEVLRMGTNRGIAAALNRGLRSAFDAGADAVVTLDQDSVMPVGGVADLVTAWAAAGDDVAYVVPEFFAGVRQAVGVDDGGRLLTRRTIQSGMLLPASTLAAVGPFLEELFIDLVDTEYSMRCHSCRLVGVAAPGLRLGHRLGAEYRRTGVLGRIELAGLTRLTLSAPYRYYYRSRNRVLVNRRKLPGTRAWRLRDTVLDLVHFAVVVSVARPRRAMLRLLISGWRDGRAGRGGRIPFELAQVAQEIRWAADLVEEDP